MDAGPRASGNGVEGSLGSTRARRCSRNRSRLVSHSGLAQVLPRQLSPKPACPPQRSPGKCAACIKALAVRVMPNLLSPETLAAALEAATDDERCAQGPVVVGPGRAAWRVWCPGGKEWPAWGGRRGVGGVPSEPAVAERDSQDACARTRQPHVSSSRSADRELVRGVAAHCPVLLTGQAAALVSLFASEDTDAAGFAASAIAAAAAAGTGVKAAPEDYGQVCACRGHAPRGLEGGGGVVLVSLLLAEELARTPVSTAWPSLGWSTKPAAGTATPLPIPPLFCLAESSHPEPESVRWKWRRRICAFTAPPAPSKPGSEPSQPCCQPTARRPCSPASARKLWTQSSGQ